MIPFMECSKQARVPPDVRSQRAAALGEVGCLMRRMPRGFWDTGIIFILNVGRDYTGVFHTQ